MRKNKNNFKLSSPLTTIENKYFLLFSLTLLLACTALLFFNADIVLADEPLAFADSPPPIALENEDFNWKIDISGGKPPYTVNILGTLPPGLTFDPVKAAITGKTLQGIPSDKYAFTIRAKDSAANPATVDKIATINVNFVSIISISTTLSGGETNVYVDDQVITKLHGGGKINRSFRSGTKHTVSVENNITVPTKDRMRFKPVNERIQIDQFKPDATFDYYPEYEITVKANQQNIPQIAGSGWYREGSNLTSTALVDIDIKQDTRYHFAYWTLPTGEILANPVLNWKVTQRGEAVATYEIHYLLSVESEHSEVEGPGWYKAGSKVRWTIKYSAIPVPGFWGHVGVELKPEKDSGTVVMNGPQEIEVSWRQDYSKLIIPVLAAVIGAIAFPVITLLHRRTRHVITTIKRQDNHLR